MTKIIEILPATVEKQGGRRVNAETRALRVHIYIQDQALRLALGDACQQPGSDLRPLTIEADCQITRPGCLIFEEAHRPGHASRMMLAGLTLDLSVHLVRRRSDRGARQQVARGGLAPHILRRVIDFLDASLLADPGLGEVAEISGLSVKHFARAFKQSTGAAPHQWMIRRRVERSKPMLCAGRESLAAVALACGFADQSHFTAMFKKVTGVTPGAYRREAGGQVQEIANDRVAA